MNVPFRVGETVHDEGFFMDRAAEVARVRRAIRGRERLLVYGERRLGKTSVLRRSARRESAQGDAVIIWADLWSLSTPGDVLRVVLGSIPWSWAPRERLVALLARADVRPTLVADPTTGRTTVEVGWNIRDLTEGRARTLLTATLRAIDTIAAEREEPVAVIFDEFQEIDRITEEGGGYLRSIIQDTGHVGYILAGSMLSSIDDLVGPRGPFYNIDRLDVGPIDAAEMAHWIAHRMQSHGVVPEPGVGTRVIALTGDSTEARVRLARETFLIGLGGTGAVTEADAQAAFAQIVDSMSSTYEVLWADLPDGQRRTLQILAAGEAQPYAAATLARYGVATSATAVRATKTLREKALVLALDPPRIADPFFAGWVRERTGGAVR